MPKILTKDNMSKIISFMLKYNLKFMKQRGLSYKHFLNTQQ